MQPNFHDDPRMLAPRRAEVIDHGGGSFELRSPDPLQPYARCVGEWIEHWAQQTPDAPAVAEPDPAGAWLRLNGSELRHRVGRIAQDLLGLQLARSRSDIPECK